MLALSTGLGFGVRWWTLRNRATLAREQFDETKADFDVGTASFAEIRAASDAALRADLDVPFQRERTAWLSYLERAKWIETKAWAALASGHSESPWECERDYYESRGERQLIERRFGLPADPRLTEYYDLLYRRYQRAGDYESESGISPLIEPAPPAPDDAAPPAPKD